MDKIIEVIPLSLESAVSIVGPFGEDYSIFVVRESRERVTVNDVLCQHVLRSSVKVSGSVQF